MPHSLFIHSSSNIYFYGKNFYLFIKNICIRLRLDLINTIYTYLRLEIYVVREEFWTLNLYKFNSPNQIILAFKTRVLLQLKHVDDFC